MKKAMNLRGRSWAGAFFLAVLVLMVAGPAKAQKGNAANGQKLFEDKCIKCHDKDGSAGTAFGKALKAADLRSADVQKKTDADFYAQIDKGKGNMPPFGNGLDKSQIEDLIAFVRQLGKSGDAKKH
ncbi:MAG TPA: cytochrome c [Candidatus Acidoferrales bacterium]|nr:cytochrome c [Candidatus Acidoferrales bacterium]